MEGCVAVTAAPGGHAGYAYALGYWLSKLGLSLRFIAARGDRWARERLEPLGPVYEVTLPRRPGESSARMILRMPRTLLESLPAVRSCRAVVSTGANLSVPPSLAGKLRRGRLAVLECATRVTSPARATRFLSRFADLLIVQWPDQVKLFPKARRVEAVGPVYEPPRYEPRDEGYVLVTAGTLGHPRLFEAVSRLGLERVVLQTGRVDPEPYQRRHPGWTVFQWTGDIDRWIAGAHVVVTHLGITAMKAALGYGKPTVIVSSPHIPTPERDARLYAERIGAVYLERVEPRALEEALKRAVENPPRRVPSGAERAARLVAELLEG